MGRVDALESVFGTTKPAIAMVHLLPLPGSPRFNGDLNSVRERALADSEAIEQAGFDGLIVENLGDEPYLVGEVPLETVAAMASIASEVRRRVSVPIGVNVQYNAWRAELAIAAAVGALFIRVEVFAEVALSGMGILTPCAGAFERYRRQLGSLPFLVLADVHTKYTETIYPSTVSLSAMRASEAGADVLIITGEATGQSTPLEDVAVAKDAVSLPVLVGAGANEATVGSILQIADGLIVGSGIKQEGIAARPVSAVRASAFMDAVRKARMS